MAINTNTVEANLTTKLNATSGTTDAKEFLLLGKAVEALTPSVTVQGVIDQGDTEITRVQTEGNTQVAAVQAAGANYAALSGATFTGAVTIPDLTVTGTTTTINVGNAMCPKDMSWDLTTVMSTLCFQCGQELA